MAGFSSAVELKLNKLLGFSTFLECSTYAHAEIEALETSARLLLFFLGVVPSTLPTTIGFGFRVPINPTTQRAISLYDTLCLNVL